MRIRSLAAATLGSLLVAAPAAAAATLLVGPGQMYATPCAAIAAAAAGDTIQVDAAGTYTGDTCAWSTDNLTVQGVNGRAKIDIGMASRALKDDERKANPDLVDTTIANDGLVFVVPNGVAVTAITSDQVRDEILAARAATHPRLRARHRVWLMRWHSPPLLQNPHLVLASEPVRRISTGFDRRFGCGCGSFGSRLFRSLQRRVRFCFHFALLF